MESIARQRRAGRMTGGTQVSALGLIMLALAGLVVLVRLATTINQKFAEATAVVQGDALAAASGVAPAPVAPGAPASAPVTAAAAGMPASTPTQSALGPRDVTPQSTSTFSAWRDYVMDIPVGAYKFLTGDQSCQTYGCRAGRDLVSSIGFGVGDSAEVVDFMVTGKAWWDGRATLGDALNQGMVAAMPGVTGVLYRHYAEAVQAGATAAVGVFRKELTGRAKEAAEIAERRAAHQAAHPPTPGETWSHPHYGVFSTATLKNGVVEKEYSSLYRFHRSDPKKLADETVELTARLRTDPKLAELIPETTSPRPGVVHQRVVHGKSWYQLSKDPLIAARAEKNAQEIVRDTQARFPDVPIAGDVADGFRFDDAGNPIGWFDPVVPPSSGRVPSREATTSGAGALDGTPGAVTKADPHAQAQAAQKIVNQRLAYEWEHPIPRRPPVSQPGDWVSTRIENGVVEKELAQIDHPRRVRAANSALERVEILREDVRFAELIPETKSYQPGVLRHREVHGLTVEELAARDPDLGRIATENGDRWLDDAKRIGRERGITIEGNISDFRFDERGNAIGWSGPVIPLPP
jgi:hypothetical protein